MYVNWTFRGNNRAKAAELFFFCSGTFCRCRGVEGYCCTSSHTVTHSHTHTHTLGRTPLEEWSARRRGMYLYNTTKTRDRHPCPQRGFLHVLSSLPFLLPFVLSIVYLYIVCPHDTYFSTTHIHAPCGIRTRNPSKRGALDRSVTGIGSNPRFRQSSGRRPTP